MSRFQLTVAVAIIGACLIASPAAAQMSKPAAGAASQTARPAEAKAEVPELDAMHAVIMPMWHDAYTSKDYKALAGMLPDIEKHMAAITKAKLPGILAEKATAWNAGVADLQKSVSTYKAAVGANKNEDLLKATEALHMQYEKLVRVIRPVLPALDDFHGALYVLYHKQTKPLDLPKAAESVELLKVKMAALNKATLPASLASKTAAFTAQRDALAKALNTLATTLATKDAAKIGDAIETMHGEYQRLEKVFE